MYKQLKLVKTLLVGNSITVHIERYSGVPQKREKNLVDYVVYLIKKGQESENK